MFDSLNAASRAELGTSWRGKSGIDAMSMKERAYETFVFMLVEGMSMMALASAIEPLRAANRFLGYQYYRWRIGSLGGGVMKSSNGLTLITEAIEEIAQEADMLLVCAGTRFDDRNERELIDILRRAARSGTLVGALSTGAHLLARAGLLDGYRSTIHWENRPAFEEAFPRVNCTGKLFEIDRRRITCGGGTAAVDLMLHLIGERHGSDLSVAVANQFHHDRIRPQSQEQRTGTQTTMHHAPDSVRRALSIMSEHIEDSLSIAQIAAAVGVSVRQLERLFMRYLGTTPGHHYLELRLQTSRELLLYSDQSITEIAIAVGFISASHFGHWFRRVFGLSPTDLRAGRGSERTVIASRLLPSRGRVNSGGITGRRGGVKQVIDAEI